MSRLRAEATLAVSFMAAIGIATIGAIDPFGGGAQLPSPRKILAVSAIWFVLGGIAATSREAARAAATFSLLVVLTMLLSKTFSGKVLTLLEGVAEIT